MKTQPQRDDQKHGEGQEGIVVWDQKGIVVVWPDGHRSRFSWAALREARLCPECRQRHASAEMAPAGFYLDPQGRVYQDALKRVGEVV